MLGKKGGHLPVRGELQDGVGLFGFFLDQRVVLFAQPVEFHQLFLEQSLQLQLLAVNLLQHGLGSVSGADLLREEQQLDLDWQAKQLNQDTCLDFLFFDELSHFVELLCE